MKRKVSKASKVKAARRARVLKTEKGKISNVVIFVVIALILALGGGAFFLTRSSSSPLAALVSAPLNPNCELHDPELCKFMNNWKTVKDYSVTSTSSDSEGAMESLFEVSGENKSHMVAKQNGKATYEMIIIDDTTYTKDFSDNKWWKQTASKESEALLDEVGSTVDFDEADIAEDKTEYKFIAKEACGNLTCFKYQIVSPDDAGFTQYIWFDDKEYRMRKQSMTDADGNTSESTFAYSGISISTPSPVKEGTAADAMGAPNMSGMSDADKAEYEKIMKEYGSQEQPTYEEASYEAPDDSYSEGE